MSGSPSTTNRGFRQAISAFLTLALLSTGVVTAAVFAVPDLVSIGMIFLILPGLILAITPTLFLYLALFSLPWFYLSRRSAALGIAGGLAAMAFVGVSLPVFLNRATEQHAAEARAKERPLSTRVDLAGVIGLKAPRELHPNVCGDLCQTLLYDAGVQRVVLMPTDRRTPVSFRVERQATCPESDPKAARHTVGSNWLEDSETSKVEAATRLRIANGECLLQEAWTGSPNWTIERVQEDCGSKPGFLSIWPGEAHVEGLQLLSANGEVLARQTEFRPRPFAVPLYLNPRGGSELRMLGWEWARSIHPPKPVKTREFLGLIASPSQLPDVSEADPDALRDALDAALSDPNANSSAFAIVEDYYRLFNALKEKQARTDDARRIARLIADPRVTTFWGIPVHAISFKSDQLMLLDPILNRLPQLAGQEKWDSYRALASVAGRLPERTFQAADPRVDAIIADPDLRRAAPALVTRLADRGPAAAPMLARIATEGWGEKKSSRFRAAPGHPNDDSRAAAVGLCRLGPAASSVLPQLQQAAVNGAVPPGVQEGDLWRSMLVALGVPAQEFNPRKNQSGSVSGYRRRLERDARERCKNHG